MRKEIFALILGFGIACSGFCYDIEELVSEENLETLRTEGVIKGFYYRQGDAPLQLIPDAEVCRNSVDVWDLRDEPVAVLENLYYFKKSEVGSGDPEKTRIPYITKSIREISTIEGIEYYSASKKQTRVLYTSAYSIKGPEDRTRVEDDTEGPSDGKVFYSMLEDSTFGKTNYRLEYHENSEDANVLFVNTSPMYLAFIKAVDTNNLKISLTVLDCGEEMLVYLVIKTRFPALSSLEQNLYESFDSRLDAIYKWLISKFD